MKAKRKIPYLILLVAVIVSLAGYSALSSGAAPAGEAGEDVRDRLAGAVVVYAGSMYSLVDNELRVIDPENELITPFVEGSRVLVPLRFIAESFGAGVTWDPEAGAAVVVVGGSTVRVTIGSAEMTVDGRTVDLDVPAVTTGERIFIPLRAVSEALGKKVFYDRGLVVISDTADIFDAAGEKQLLDDIIADVNRIPSVGTREKLVEMLNEAGASAIFYGGVESMRAAADGAKEMAPSVNGGEASEGGGHDYSATNVQVEGVDEADIVKTDGTYIYQVSGQRVMIYRAYPAGEMALAGSISYTDGQFAPLELYINGDSLVVIGSTGFGPAVPEQENGLKVPGYYPAYQDAATKALVYDVSDRSSPLIVREASLQGSYVSSRMIGNDLYLVSNRSIYNWQDETAPLNPQYRDSAAGEETVSIPYADIKYILPVVSPSYLMVAGLSLDEPEKPLNAQAYLGAGEEIYVSRDNLYVSVSEGYGGIRPMWMMEDALTAPTAREATLIYKFSLRDGAATYQARGQVPGRILNQFSMDESDGRLRVATTLGDSWMSGDDASGNNVYILDEGLNVTGKLEDMAKGEKIYSVRFMGDRAYVVTFKTVDPLFVIDLGDPWNPSVLGALKIPGYSDYLHPYDETHIIGFGKDTVTVPVKDGAGNVIDTSSYYLGMKVALFDVSDVSAPVEKFSVKIGDRGTDSELLYDHKALLFDREKELLAFPVSEAKVDGEILDPYSGFPNYGRTVFSGAYVYNLNLEDGFVLKGKISHLTSEDELKSGYYAADYNKRIRRLLFIDRILYGVSDSGISAHDMESLGEIGRVSGS